MISRITFYKKTSLTQIFLFFFIPSYIYSMEESMTLQPEESQLLQAVSLDHAEGPVVQKSGVWTIFKYGLTKTVAGQTSFSIFQALAENGTLEGDFLEQPTEALNRYNDALIERFEKKRS